MANEARRLVILDGYSLLYRAFFATRYLSTSDGRPTNALFGFSQMLFTLLERVRPHAVVVAMDAPGPTFRHREYDAYKAGRRETADELRVQLREAREMVTQMGIPIVEAVGFEADDVVGTISRLGEENGYDTTIVTGDLDALQLVDACVSVMTPQVGVTDVRIYDPAAVVERYGFGPEFIPDFKAIKGDTSDNIPGVPGIGDKRAAELIQGFGTVEAMLERFAELPPKFQKKIAGNEAQMRASKRLATIVRDVPLTYGFDPFVLTQDELNAAVAMLERFEFRQLVKRAPALLGRYLEGAAPLEIPSTETPKVEQVEEGLSPRTVDADGWDDLVAFVGDGEYALYLPSAPAKGLFDDAPGEGPAYVALGLRVLRTTEADARRLFRERPAGAIAHDAKPLYRGLSGTTPPPAFDTLLAAYVLRSERSSYPVREMIQSYLDVAPPETPEQIAAGIHLLARPLAERLEKEGQTRVLRETELPLVPILAEMEGFGVCVEAPQLREFSAELTVAVDRAAQRVFEIAGRKFLIGSPKQLGEVLFDELKLPGAKKTATGYATGVEILGELAAEHEIAALVLEWRELTRLKNTYADSLEKLIAADGRIHTTYNQTVAATGRLSSNDPNLQNIPIRTELGRGIRRAFHAERGFTLASLDYSQIELRVLAHMSHEPALVEAFSTGQDVHTVTAARMFPLDGGKPTKEQRRLAKMLNYAVLYGVSEFGLAQQLGTGFSISDAKELIVQYNETLPGIRAFTKGIVAEARSRGFTATLLGRRRYFPDIHAGKINDRRYAERQAMNAPIQGTAADLLKLAMIRCRAVLDGGPSRMLLNVHDELVFEIADGDEGVIPRLREAMENALPLNVPIEVDAKVGPDWNDMRVVPR